MVLQVLTFAEPIDHRGLGGAELDPFRAIQLYPLVELFRDFERFLVHFLEPIELALKGELTGERLLQRPAPPYRDSSLAFEVMPEVDDAERILHLLDRDAVDQRHFGSGLYVNLLESRKRARDVLDAAIQFNLGRSKNASMRIDAAHPAQTIALEQQLFLELYLVVSAELRTHVNGRSGLEVLGAVFEGQLVPRAGPSLIIKSALAQDKVVVEEVKLGSVVEEYFPNLAVECVMVNVNPEPEFLETPGRRFPKFEETMFAGKPVGLQQNLVLAIVNYIAAEMFRIVMLAYVLVHGCTYSK